MRTEDVVLTKEKISQPSPFTGWIRVMGQNKIDMTNLQSKMQHIVDGYDKRVYAFLPVEKGDKIHIKGNFLWGRFYEIEMIDNYRLKN